MTGVEDRPSGIEAAQTAPAILVVDDDAAVRASVAALLAAGGVPVATFADWPALLAHRRADAGPAVLLLDVRLGRANGLELYEQLVDEGLGCPVIFMTAYADVSSAVRALRLSATDFLVKPFGRADLFAALDRAREKALATGEADHTGEIAERYRTLSPREQEVFAAMADGQSTKQIARTLGISPRTVEVHRSRVLQKMETDSVATLVRMAIALGVSGPPGEAG